MNKPIPPIVEKIVNIIVAEVQPEKIILFGSYARGDYNEHSDIDLLVMKKNLENNRDLSHRIRRTLFPYNLNISTDILSIDYDKYYEVCDDLGYVYRTIKQEGKIVYESI